MNLLRFCLLLAPILFTTPAKPDDDRINRLSSLAAILEGGSEWQTKTSRSKIEFSCLSCGGAVEATIEIIAPYGRAEFGTREQRYLAERKALCFKLVAERLGRCVRTGAISMRGGGIKGFQSRHEVANTTVIEIVFFHVAPPHGPELLKTTLSIEDGASAPRDIAGFFRWNMLRLTALW